MINEKTVTVGDNKKIYIFDDLFSFNERISLFTFMKKSLFYIYASDGVFDQYENQICSKYNEQDVLNMGFFDTNGFKFIDNKFSLTTKQISQARVNYCLPTEGASPHTDNCNLTLLYYANMEWKLEWGGHTSFLNESLTDIEYVCAYKPGRLVVFDGNIPHMILLPNIQSTFGRISFVIQYRQRKSNEE